MNLATYLAAIANTLEAVRADFARADLDAHPHEAELDEIAEGLTRAANTMAAAARLPEDLAELAILARTLAASVARPPSARPDPGCLGMGQPAPLPALCAHCGVRVTDADNHICGGES